jgi:hypothetical protein
MLRRAILAFSLVLGFTSVYPSFAADAAQPLLLSADEVIR